MEEKIRELEARRSITMAGGGAERIAQQHEKGKLTARERIARLLDEGSFMELGTFVQADLSDAGGLEPKNPGEGVVTGSGTIRQAGLYLCPDFTVAGGSLGEMHAARSAGCSTWPPRTVP